MAPRFSITQQQQSRQPVSLADMLGQSAFQGQPRTTLEGVGKLAQLLASQYVKRKEQEKALADQQTLLGNLFGATNTQAVPGQGIESFPRPDQPVLSGPDAAAAAFLSENHPGSPDEAFDAPIPGIEPFVPPSTKEVPVLAGQAGDLGRMLLGQGGPATAGRNEVLQALLTRGFGQQDTEAAQTRALEIARAKPGKDTRTPLQKEAAGLFPNDPAAQKKYITDGRNKPMVSINDGNIDKSLLDLDVAQIKTQQTENNAFRSLEPRLEMVATILSSGKVDTGRFAQATLPLRQMAQELGLADDPNLSAEEQAHSSMAFLVARMRVPGSGATSDKEMANFAKSTANPANTTTSNIIISRAFLQIQKRGRRNVEESKRYLRANKSLDGVEDHLEKKFGLLFPAPQTQQEYDALPSKTVYLDGDGAYKVKR